MKFCILLFASIVLFNASAAEHPERIQPRTKIIRSSEWYQQQSILWRERVSINAADAEAWVNYFLASRYASVEKTELERIASECSKAIPGTFESLVILALTNEYTPKGFDHLRQAHAVQPDNPMLFGDLLLMHEYMLDPVSRREISTRLFATSLVTPSLLNYSYNVLMSLEKNAVLFTDSDNTTLPIFLLQDVLGTRPDVTVLNLDMLVSEEYRQRKLSAEGMQLNGVVAASRPELCAVLPQQNPDKTFYYALTLARQAILPVKDQLYVTGLASRLSSERIDNIAMIRSNLENQFLLDYLTVDFNGENEFAAGRVLSSNYLVPMLLLLEHYRAVKESDKAAALEKQIKRLAEERGKSALVENFLTGRATNVPFIPYQLDTRALEGQFKRVKNNVYAHEYEVTNRQYNEFLQYLQKNNLTEKYETCRIQLQKYEEPALSFMSGYHSNRQPTKKEKYFLMYPVINITYEAAVEYCQWLTDQYNNSAEKKYKKVRFRLPTLAEWQLAAAGVKNPTSWILDENKMEVKQYEDGKEYSKRYKTMTVSMADPEIQYPWFINWWFRNKPLNARGCALGNFKFPDTLMSCVPNKLNTADGFLLMSPVQAYFPNEIGLYDVVGNVAEMVNEKGKACGGSWNHPPELSTIRSVNEYNGSDSNTGFRVFMEVIEN